VFVPARGGISLPAVEERWRVPVIADRHSQDVRRHADRVYRVPRAVVPSAAVPVVILKNPVQAIVEK
jgi:hypothetical protein